MSEGQQSAGFNPRDGSPDTPSTRHYVAIPRPDNPNGQLSVGEFISKLHESGWVEAQARRFQQFFGSMKLESFGEANVLRFLHNFERSWDIYWIARCLDSMSYWNVHGFAELFTKKIRPEVIKAANRLGKDEVFFAVFGNPQDSSSLIASTVLKEIEPRSGSLLDFLTELQSPGGRSVGRKTAICFLDDNLVRGVQAGAMFKQWMGQTTPEEETHVQPLPLVLQEELQRSTLIFATVVGTDDGANRLRSAAAGLRLNVEILDPAYRSEAVDIGHAFPDHAEREAARQVLRKYGKELLRDKVGPGWNESKREEYALGYGGRALLFLFPFQIATSVPVLFWRSGRYKGREWHPLFPRCSDFERFCINLDLQEDYVTRSKLVRRLYCDFVAAEELHLGETGEELTYDQKLQLFSDVRTDVSMKKDTLAVETKRNRLRFWQQRLPSAPLFTPSQNERATRTPHDDHEGNQSVLRRTEHSRVPPALFASQEARTVAIEKVVTTLKRKEARETAKRNLESLFRPHTPTDLFIPAEDAQAFLEHISSIAFLHRVLRSKTGILCEYRAWKG